MRRWHQFNDGTPARVRFGHGTDQQARHCLDLLNRHKVSDHYHLTHLEEGEEPRKGDVLLDLDSGEILPSPHQGPATDA